MPQRLNRLLGLIALAVLFVPIYGRYLVGYSPSGGDIVNQYLPYQELIRNSVRQGAAPLWNPMTFCGRPLMGDIQVGVLYPPNWLHWVLPLPLSFALVLAAHAIWMLAGCWLLGRKWGLHPAAIALGTVLFAGSPFFTLKMSQGVILFIYVGAWWPWLGLATMRLAERPNAARMIVMGITLAMSLLAGSPQITFYGWLTTLALGLIVPGEKGAAPWMKRAGLIAGAFVLAMALTAIQTFQTYHFVGNSFERGGGAGWDYITNGSLAPRLLWLLLNPGYLGVGHSATEFYWAFPPDFAESCYYLPLWSLAMFVPMGLGLLAPRADVSPLHKRLAILALTAIALGLLLALGKSSPLFALFYKIVPGFDRFRVPARLMLVYTAGVAVLASLAYHRLLAAWPKSAGRAIAIGLIAIVVLVWGSYALRMPIWKQAGYRSIGGFLNGPEMDKVVSAHALMMAMRVTGFAALAALALWKLLQRRTDGLAFALPIIAAAELALLAWPFQAGGDPYNASTPIAKYNETFYKRSDVVKTLQNECKNGGRVLWLTDVNTWALDQNQMEIYPNRMIMHGLPDARGYDPVNARWIGRWMNLLTGRDPNANPGGLMFVGRIARPAWLTLMGVSAVITYRDLSDIPGLKPVAHFDFPIAPEVDQANLQSVPDVFLDPATNQLKTRLTIWRNERFRGMAFAAPMPKVAKDAESALDDAAKLPPDASIFDAIVADKSFIDGKTWPVAKIDDRFVVRALPSNPNTFRYETNYPAPAMLCLAQSGYGGWTARIGETPVAISALNGTFLSVMAPAGRNEVTFEFHPEGLAGGMWISLAAIGFILYVSARGFIVNRKR
ncbi:YfhO family protein [bacterium]|nr:YfhO family protein [bacterium]